MLAGLASLRALIPVALVVATFGAGWTSHSWYRDAQTLAAEQGAQAAINADRERQSSIAEAVEERLASQRTTERVIDRGVIREIQKPIYQRVCAEPDAVRLLNDAAAGRRPASTDAADAVSDDAAGGG